MQHTTLRFPIVFSALILFSGNAAQADVIHFTWHSTITPSSIPAVQAGGGSLGLVGAGGAATYFGRPGYNYSEYHEVGATYRTSSFQGAVYDNQPITLALKLTDSASGLSDVLTFHGIVNGGGDSYPNVFWSDNSRTVTIGQDIYYVQMPNDYYWLDGLEPYPYYDMFAKIDVSPASNTPEPSSLLLASMALLVEGFARWKKPVARTNKS